MVTLRAITTFDNKKNNISPYHQENNSKIKQVCLVRIRCKTRTHFFFYVINTWKLKLLFRYYGNTTVLFDVLKNLVPGLICLFICRLIANFMYFYILFEGSLLRSNNFFQGKGEKISFAKYRYSRVISVYGTN